MLAHGKHPPLQCRDIKVRCKNLITARRREGPRRGRAGGRRRWGKQGTEGVMKQGVCV